MTKIKIIILTKFILVVSDHNLCYHSDVHPHTAHMRMKTGKKMAETKTIST